MTEAERNELRTVAKEHDQALAAGDVERHLVLDPQFHVLIRDGAHNARLAADLVRLGDQILLVMRTWSLAPGGMGAGTRRDHGAIARAVMSGDADAAEAAARRHVRNIAAFVALGQHRPSAEHSA
jgi:DNA-binding GntR family transcriptional regulator